MKKIRTYGMRKHNSFTSYQPQYQLAKMKWVFHPFDVDPFPSVPHGHSVDKRGYKLHVHTGDIYKGKNIWGKIKKKDFVRLLNDSKFLQLVEEAKNFHENKTAKKNVRVYRKKITMRRHSLEFIFESEVEKYK